MMFDPRTPQVWVGEVGFVTSFLDEAEFFPAQTNAFVLPAPFFQFLGMQNCDNSTQSLHVSMHSSMEHGLTRTNQKCNKFFRSCHTMHETASLLEALRFKSIRPFSAFRCELLHVWKNFKA